MRSLSALNSNILRLSYAAALMGCCTIYGFASTASTGWSEISPVVAQGWRGSPWP